MVNTEYLKALIYYEGIQRIEQFMFPQQALREILLNAVAYKDYSACNPIRISVYEDKVCMCASDTCNELEKEFE